MSEALTFSIGPDGDVTIGSYDELIRWLEDERAQWSWLALGDTTQNKAPVALYVVISGGLLLLSTIAFWVGRLLTKLYLSEHHLRNDAEERAVMTTTYLALINEAAASDTDRQIILNALFRATPDGIVKDEGPTDASVQGLLTKLLTR